VPGHPGPATAATFAGDEADLYQQHADALYRIVRAAVRGPDQLVEDACQTAWLILLRRQPGRQSVLPWLITVAIREAYRLSRRDRREVRLEDLIAHDDSAGEADGWQSLIPAPATVEQSVEARTALETLADLPPRQRRYMALFVAGYRYREIEAICGVTYTNVNNHLVRARARLREHR
jgi:RNA polymerase sigma factor (sigma-70 family)